MARKPLTDYRLPITDDWLGSRSRFYQTLEQPQHMRRIVNEVFGMPLHANGIRMINHFDTFNEAVWGNGRCPERTCQPSYTLMMQTIYGRFRAAQLFC